MSLDTAVALATAQFASFIFKACKCWACATNTNFILCKNAMAIRFYGIQYRALQCSGVSFSHVAKAKTFCFAAALVFLLLFSAAKKLLNLRQSGVISRIVW